MPLSEEEIMQFGIPRMVVSGDEDDAIGMEAPPPTFPPVPSHYVAIYTRMG